MDPNKRGNPPFEPSSYAAGLERRVTRYHAWQMMALAMAEKLMGDDPVDLAVARDWWASQLNPLQVVLSDTTLNAHDEMVRS